MAKRKEDNVMLAVSSMTEGKWTQRYQSMRYDRRKMNTKMSRHDIMIEGKQTRGHQSMTI